MTTFSRTLAGALAVVALSAAPAFAGQLTSIPDPALNGPINGWTFTPALLFSRTYDDNVLLRGSGDIFVTDYINVINPRTDVNFHSPRSDVSMRYDGTFFAYQQLTALNSYDQHGGINARRRLSKRTAFFLSANAQKSPTTELLQFVDVPYLRVGSFSDDVSGGFDTLVNKRLSVTATAHFTQVTYDQNAFTSLLLGGNSVGGGVSVHERLTERMTLTGDYDVQHATIGTANDVFDIQSGTAGFDYQVTQNLHAFAAGGFSRVDAASLGPPHVGPSWKLGISDHYRATVIDLSYSRAYVPSFGLGGAIQDQDATASLKMPITRRLYAQGILSWHRDDALIVAIPELRSVWIQAAVGYVAKSWIRLEAYYASTQQNIGARSIAYPDGRLSHDQVGFQVITSKPMRIH